MQAIEVVMAEAADLFVHLLRKRLASEVFTTEDSVRYTFFAALLRSGVEPEQVIVEARYQSIPGAELDMLLYSPAQIPLAAVEFKYDREIPSGRNAPRTQKAGKLFADLRRLLLWSDPVARYFIYVNTGESYRYLMSPRNGLSAIFTLRPGETLNLETTTFAGLSTTFRTTMKEWSDVATVGVMVNEPLPHDHHVWICTIQAGERPA